MRSTKYAGIIHLLVAVGACVLMAGVALADVATERPGSLLIFPKVTRDATHDTTIQISNTGNMPDAVECFYLNGSSCNETDFSLFLTKQQPTHWSVSTGRNGTVGTSTATAGLSPGQIPPVPLGFTGALVCVEVDPTTGSTPLGQNQLKGEANITVSGSGDIGSYNAVAVQAGRVTNSNILSLNNVEYNACSTANLLNFIAGAETDPVIEALGNGGVCGTTGVPCNANADCANVPSCDTGTGHCVNSPSTVCTSSGDCPALTCTGGGSQVQTSITVVPCQLDFNTLTFTPFSLNFTTYDENETRASAGGGTPPVTCWANIPINGSTAGAPTTTFATSVLTSTTGTPFVAVEETVRTDTAGNSTLALTNLHGAGICAGVSPPQPCQANFDCGSGGTCNLTTSSTITLSSGLQ